MFFRSLLYKRMILSDLRKISRLPRDTQASIAVRVVQFLNIAKISKNEALLEQFLLAALQERHDAIARGAKTVTDPRWAAPAISEAWCSAKLGGSRGKLSKSAANAIVAAIEAFAYDVQHKQHLTRSE